MMRIVRTLIIVSLIACSLSSQTPAPRPTFEVASIKIKATSDGGPADMVPRRSGNRVSMHNITLELVIPYAYHVPRGYPLEGDLDAPDDWKWFDIEAVAPGSPTDDQIRVMFQSLLEDRFKLRVHHETQQREVYALVPGKRKPKLKEWQLGEKPLSVRDRPVPEGTMGNFSSREEPYHVAGRKVPMTKLASYLRLMLRTLVIDKTGLSGDFDLELVWGSQGEERPSGPPDPAEVAAALQAQIGLGLVRSKEPIDVLVVDRFEKPSAK